MTLQGRYTILGEIAAGGTATVFLAEDSVLRRKVALKKLHPHLLNHPEMVRRFEKEAVAVASLSHENVIKIFDYGREDKAVFLAMEYVDGASLDSLLRDCHGIIPNLTALTLFHQLLEGLAAAHACGICHRDIKPSNVLINLKGCVLLADFGIAFLSEETSFTRTGAYLGTPGYSAPEQAEGRTVSEKTDIFAAGTLLYRCLTGRMPFTGGSPHALLKAIVEKTQPKANFVNPRILPGLADLIQDMLAKSPEQRPDAQTCLQRLESIASGLGYPLDSNRICRLVADPVEATARESKELAGRYAHQARVVAKLGKHRDALKLYSLAELFSEKDSEVGREAARFVRRNAVRTRMRAIASIAVATGLAGLGWMALAGRESPPAPAPMPAPAAPANATAAAAAPAVPVSLELPLEVPAWPRRPKAPARPAPVGKPAPAAAAATDGNPAGTASAAGWFSVKTNPPFARVIVDGEEVATTPMAGPIQLPIGTHSLRLIRAGCQTLEREFEVTALDTAILRITMERTP